MYNTTELPKNKRTHTKEQDKLIKDTKFKYVTASSQKEQDYYAKIMAEIRFF